MDRQPSNLRGTDMPVPATPDDALAETAPSLAAQRNPVEAGETVFASMANSTHASAPASVALDSPEAGAPDSTRGRFMRRIAWSLALIATVVLFVVGQGVGISMGVSFTGWAHTALHAQAGMSDAQLQALVHEGVALGLNSGTLAGQLVVCTGQLVAFAMIAPVWTRMRRRAFVPCRARVWSRRDVVRIVGALVVGGIGFQFAMSPVLSVLSSVFVQTFEEYGALMQRAAGTAALVEFVSVVMLAPLLEEVACRGVMLECGLRALLPWSKLHGPRGIAVSARAFWAANALQALAFAIMHGNVVQSSYALVFGLALGWVCWRTGRLRYAVLLHMVVNASAYLLSAFELLTAELLGPLALLLALALIGIGCLAASWRSLKPLLASDAPGLMSR